MIGDRCKPLNEGEPDTVRIVMTVNEAKQLLAGNKTGTLNNILRKCTEASSSKSVPGPELAQWILEVQKSVHEEVAPRSLRCFWCGCRFSSSYHDAGCPLRTTKG